MIGGFTPCSFIDYPGRLSAVVFLRGCNLRCPYCHNAELIRSEGPAVFGEAELLEFLAARRGRLDGVVFSGGEPTLQPGLRALIEAVRGLGYLVKLDTNGTRPAVLAELLAEGVLDYVAVDLKDEPAAYPAWLGMREAPEALERSLELLWSSGVDHELRTTVAWPRQEDPRLDRMARWAAGGRRWFLQACRAKAGVPDSRVRSDAEIEALAAQLRDRHGVRCRGRSEISR